VVEETVVEAAKDIMAERQNPKKEKKKKKKKKEEGEENRKFKKTGKTFFFSSPQMTASITSKATEACNTGGTIAEPSDEAVFGGGSGVTGKTGPGGKSIG